jgi:Anti-sigma factor NepR
MREAITRELQALYRAQQDEPLPERLTNLLQQLEFRKAGTDQAGSA